MLGIYDSYKESGLEIIEVSFQDEFGNPSSSGDLERFAKLNGIDYTVVNDPDESTVDTYEIVAVPTNLVIGRDFIIDYRDTGFDRSAAIEGNL